MLYIVEIPHQRKPTALAYLDRADLVERVRAVASSKGHTVYERTSVREMADQHGVGIDSLAEAEAGLEILAERYGLDTALYATWETEQNTEVLDRYSATDPGEWASAIGYLADDLHALVVFESDGQAFEELEGLLATDRSPSWKPRLPAHQYMEAYEGLLQAMVKSGAVADTKELDDALRAAQDHLDEELLTWREASDAPQGRTPQDAQAVIKLLQKLQGEDEYGVRERLVLDLNLALARPMVGGTWAWRPPAAAPRTEEARDAVH